MLPHQQHTLCTSFYGMTIPLSAISRALLCTTSSCQGRAETRCSVPPCAPVCCHVPLFAVMCLPVPLYATMCPSVPPWAPLCCHVLLPQLNSIPSLPTLSKYQMCKRKQDTLMFLLFDTNKGQQQILNQFGKSIFEGL